MNGVMRAAAILLLLVVSLAAQSPDPRKLFQEAVAAQQRGDDATAVREYRELLRLQPNAVPVRVNLGATLAHLHRFDEAIEQYRLALAADPGNAGARLNLALAYQEKGEIKHAARELEILHRAQPDDAQPALLLGDCYVRLEQYARAVTVLLPIEAAEKDDLDLAWLLGSALIHSGKPVEGVQRIDKVAASAANADAYLLAGQTRLAMDQYDLARSDAEAALRLNPTLAGAQTLNGMVLEHTGDFEGAKAALQKALQADSRGYDAHFYLGSIFYFERNMAEARVHLQRALDLQPKSAQARYKLALVERTEGQANAALHDLQAVIHQDPDWVEPHAELAALYFRLKRPEDGAREKQIVDRLIAAQQAGGERQKKSDH